MRIIHRIVAGLDVHKKTVVATRMQVNEEERLVWETQTFGTMTQDLLAELCVGQMSPQTMAELARGRLRSKIPELEKALTGVVEPHHRFLLSSQLAHIDFLDEQVADISTEIGRQLEEMSSPSSAPGDGKRDTAPDTRSATDEHVPPLTWQEAVALLDTIPG